MNELVDGDDLSGNAAFCVYGATAEDCVVLFMLCELVREEGRYLVTVSVHSGHC